jgi:hypothetical protein
MPTYNAGMHLVIEKKSKMTMVGPPKGSALA